MMGGRGGVIGLPCCSRQRDMVLLARQLGERGRRSGVPIAIPPPLRPLGSLPLPRAVNRRASLASLVSLVEDEENDDEDGEDENEEEVVGVEEYTPLRARGSCTVGQKQQTTDISQSVRTGKRSDGQTDSQIDTINESCVCVVLWCVVREGVCECVTCVEDEGDMLDQLCRQRVTVASYQLLPLILLCDRISS